jgi:hypothetical protein
VVEEGEKVDSSCSRVGGIKPRLWMRSLHQLRPAFSNARVTTIVEPLAVGMAIRVDSPPPFFQWEDHNSIGSGIGFLTLGAMKTITQPRVSVGTRKSGALVKLESRRGVKSGRGSIRGRRGGGMRSSIGRWRSARL